jgi:uncharacterized protein YjbI with pentapeptide repeats
MGEVRAILMGADFTHTNLAGADMTRAKTGRTKFDFAVR